MIDYIKIALKCVIYAEYLRTHRLLKDRREIKNTDTGNVTVIGKYKGLSFTIHQSGYVVIDGSLHKYFNDGHHNYNDFSLTNIKQVVDELAGIFGQQILTAKILNLEYGLNLNTPFKPVEFTNNILTYLRPGIESRGRQKTPITKDDRKGFDKGIKFILSQYQLKIYDKGNQYGTGLNTLRIELKTLKTEVIAKANIQTLQDLANRNKLAILHEKLMYTFSFIIVREVMDAKHLTNNERAIWQECINPDNWIYEWNRDKRKKRKAQFSRIQTKYALSDMKAIITELLESKFLELTASKSIHTLTGVRDSKVSTL